MDSCGLFIGRIHQGNRRKLDAFTRLRLFQWTSAISIGVLTQEGALSSLKAEYHFAKEESMASLASSARGW